MRLTNTTVMLLAIVGLWGAPGVTIAGDPSISVLGLSEARTNRADVRLGDLAEVRVAFSKDAVAASALQDLVVARGLEPGTRIELEARTILDSLTAQGVDTKEIGYRFPSRITLERIGRKLEPRELEGALREALLKNSDEATLVRVSMTTLPVVSPDTVVKDAKVQPRRGPGERIFSLRLASQAGEREVEVRAQVEEWVEVVVLARSLGRGSIVEPSDVTLTRARASALPSDAGQSISEVVGKRTKETLAVGEIMRVSALTTPPLIEAGAQVTMIYRTDFFEATASGVTLESALQGQEIKVRNDRSKKIITGIASEPGLVEVGVKAKGAL